ncbi:DUF423 domain-containing protein [Psychromonas sp. 14N.309.X.WAT.B.A12]|uniref:DUF423 domain-containing protein n=1 Tax=unclassified Psychromonas TaxID=2614957 RepID=UPI0025AEF92E|nr:DUF423 domain-containing protein [Psychromonas sp. 14N.309.X.WAT.B.A12]MDN2662022.1 DUF423 domain-containing protein [Psychromonas sp. 14N.309.X.WAT.B.A12]
MKISTQSRCFIAVAALLGATAVMFGAYASHGLSTWANPEQISQVKLAAQYQLFHALALLMTTILSSLLVSRLLTLSLYCFSIGTLCFSGSLYYWVFFTSKLLVLITPLGGLLLIVAWLSIALAMVFSLRK